MMSIPTVLQLRQLCADIDALGLDKLHLGPIGGSVGRPRAEPMLSLAGNTYVDIVERHQQAVYRVSHVLPAPEAPSGAVGQHDERCRVLFANSPWSTQDLPSLGTAVGLARGESPPPNTSPCSAPATSSASAAID